MYLSMVVLLIGSELASELHKGTGAVRTRAGHLFDGRISNGGPTDRPSVEHIERVVPVATEPLPARRPPVAERGGSLGVAQHERPPRAD
jgi:hypothetical protein